METINKLADQQQSFRDEIKSVAKPPSEAVVDQISVSDPKLGTSQQSDLQIHPSLDEPMETQFAGPPLPPQFVQRFESEIPLEGTSEQTEAFQTTKPKKHSDKKTQKSRAKYLTSSSSSEESEVSVQVKRSSKPKGDSTEQIKTNLDPDPVFYREVDMSDLPSQYTKDIETFRQILKLPDPRDNMPMSSTTV